jgi:polyisoprenoid-binding protein YceI
MSTTTIEQQIPAGTWNVDKIHSSIGFAVKHMVVSTFRGKFDDYDAELTAGEDGATLRGAVRVASVDVKDETLEAHLQSPDFFDAERHPELRFDSKIVRRDGDEVVVEGELTIRGATHPVEARGTISGPHIDLGDSSRLGLELEASVDRRAYGLEWNAPLPKGGVALGDEVTLLVNLEFVRTE